MEHTLTSVMTSHGYLALIIFAFIEACCIPISSEITFAWAGLSVATVHNSSFSLLGVIVIGTLAEMGGSLTSYGIGRVAGRPLIERHERWVRWVITKSELDRAERFFAGRGSWVVAPARALPLVRCFASLGAGVVEIPVVPFTIFSFIGTAAWATGLTLLGYNLQNAVTKFFHSFSLIGAALLIVFLVGLVAHRIHVVRKDATSEGHHRQDQGGAQATKPRVGTGRSGGAHRSGRGSST
jgi:membrane protein DedA with SNARE-associated domain